MMYLIIQVQTPDTPCRAVITQPSTQGRTHETATHTHQTRHPTTTRPQAAHTSDAFGLLEAENTASSHAPTNPHHRDAFQDALAHLAQEHQDGQDTHVDTHVPLAYLAPHARQWDATQHVRASKDGTQHFDVTEHYQMLLPRTQEHQTAAHCNTSDCSTLQHTKRRDGTLFYALAWYGGG